MNDPAAVAKLEAMSCEDVVAQASERRDFINALRRILRQHNPQDSYWADLYSLGRGDDIFEHTLLINWIGSHLRPERVMEIGTRTGGSLIALMAALRQPERTEIHCFDLWREYHRVCRLRGLVKRMPLALRMRWAMAHVKRNLSLLGLPCDQMYFYTGDSSVTVPQFLARDPRPFDYILVDGSHDKKDARTDLENTVNALAPGGVVVFDDIGDGYHLLDVWEAFIEAHKDLLRSYVWNKGQGVAWAVRKALS